MWGGNYEGMLNRSVLEEGGKEGSPSEVRNFVGEVEGRVKVGRRKKKNRRNFF